MDEISTLHETLQFNNELLTAFLTAYCMQLGWVEKPVSEQEKANEAIEDNEDER